MGTLTEKRKVPPKNGKERDETDRARREGETRRVVASASAEKPENQDLKRFEAAATDQGRWRRKRPLLNTNQTKKRKQDHESLTAGMEKIEGENSDPQMHSIR